MKNRQKTLDTISAFNVLTDPTTPRANGLSSAAGSAPHPSDDSPQRTMLLGMLAEFAEECGNDYPIVVTRYGEVADRIQKLFKQNIPVIQSATH